MVREEMSQLFRFRLKSTARANIESIIIARDVSQFMISLLNDAASWNMAVNISTLPVSHARTSPLKLVLPENMKLMSVTRAVSQSWRSLLKFCAFVNM
jgi:hypothetical protein